MTLLPLTLRATPREPQTPPSPQPSTPGVETRVKIVPKPVPCVPCPCECPELRGNGSSAGAGTGGNLGTSEPGTPEPRVSDPRTTPGAETHPIDNRGIPELRPQDAPRPVAPPPPSRGTITGAVQVRDRGGRERSDQSDVVVYIEKMPQRRFGPLKRTRFMAQRDKTFTPHVLAVTKGSTVEFPNEDKFFHNVFSLSDGNTFDLGLYRAGSSKSVTFDKTGVIDVYCNIHPNMWAQILVLDNPFYAVTGKDGAFEIPKVPVGTYTVVAWVTGSDPVKQQVRVDANGRAQVKFELREGATNKPHLNKYNQPYGRYK